MPRLSSHSAIDSCRDPLPPRPLPPARGAFRPSTIGGRRGTLYGAWVTIGGRWAGIVLTLIATHAAASDEPVSLRAVAVAGQPAPGGGVFEHFSVESQPVIAPPNAKGEVAFFATLLRAPGSEGIFLSSGRGISKVAAEGDRAPGGGTLSGLGRHPVPSINAAGAVAFAAAVAGGRTVEGVFV